MTLLLHGSKQARWRLKLTTATFANSAEKIFSKVLNLFWTPCVMDMNEVWMDWFYGIYKTFKPNL